MHFLIEHFKLFLMEKIYMLIYILNALGQEEVQIKNQNVSYESGLCNPDLVY